MESQRLFYVAATRARDHLVFLGRPKPPKPEEEEDKKGRDEADTWFKAVLDCPAAADLSAELVLDPAGFSESPSPEAAASAPRPPAPDSADLRLLAPMTLAGASLSVTELAHWLAEYFDFSTDFPETRNIRETTAPPWPAAAPPAASANPLMTPREAGLLFHAVMAIIDPREPYPREILVAEAVRLGLALETPDALAGAVEFFLASPWGRDWLEAREAGRHVFREWPFQLRLRERGEPARHLKVNGVIDLFFQTPGGGRIVDYKLADFSSESGGNLAVYENQVRLYALALKSSGLATDLKAVLYFAGGARPHFHEVDLESGWAPELWENFFKNFFGAAGASPLRL
jgi:ATP-dependent exoDNAse (exonuclease V) beta subunit